ncbi:MAG TPA: D-alanyl-D-alanine carboxypeptidase family protein [Thermodesulfobacteriota bacterium]|nr:D-alanyl-D-alanine carboxypeptidase family protein [Thermodesulfobacteriota bacterium]
MRMRIQVLFFMVIFFVVLTADGMTGVCQENFPVNAKAAALLDFNSGQFLLAKNANEKIEPASFTKVMTLYVVQDGLKSGAITLKDMVTISERAWSMGGSQMFLKVGTQESLEALLKGIAVVSANDACVAVAEHMSGKVEVFVEEMNRKARELGLTNTIFVNVHGLPADGQFTSARDMAILASHYIKDYPQVLNLHSMQEFAYNNITQRNRNGLLKMNVGVDGLKTGYIKTSGYHLLATAQREGRRLIAVVMGAEKPKIREAEALNLLNYGFRNFILKEVLKKGGTVKTIPVKGGKFDTVELIAQDSVIITVPVREKESVKTTESIPARIAAPIKKGTVVGQVTVEVGGKQIRQVNVLAKNDVPRGWQRYLKIGGVILGVIVVLLIFRSLVGRRRPKDMVIR